MTRAPSASLSIGMFATVLGVIAYKLLMPITLWIQSGLPGDKGWFASLEHISALPLLFTLVYWLLVGVLVFAIWFFYVKRKYIHSIITSIILLIPLLILSGYGLLIFYK